MRNVSCEGTLYKDFGCSPHGPFIVNQKLIELLLLLAQLSSEVKLSCRPVQSGFFQRNNHLYLQLQVLHTYNLIMSTSSATSSFNTTIAPTDLAGQASQQRQIGQKRKAAAAGIDSGAANTGRAARARFFTKRRAAKACQCCRARKVRCNVTEHGAPCTNCRLDEVECVVSEGRRKRYELIYYLIFNALGIRFGSLDDCCRQFADIWHRKLPGLGNKNGNINIILPQSGKKEQPRRLSSHSSVIDWLDDESNSEECGYSHAGSFILDLPSFTH